MRRISLEDLHIFRCVAVEGGVLRAAARLNRVPSNVTTRIKQFESRLGTQLFRRKDGTWCSPMRVIACSGTPSAC